MRELPILFSAPMVRAILDGRKTVTRRVVKPQPREDLPYPKIDPALPGLATWCSFKTAPGILFGAWVELKLPYEVGDQLYVRETTEVDEDTSAAARLSRNTADKAPVLVRGASDPAFNGTVAHWDYSRRSRPGIHLPKLASRIWLEVTAVRVERLQDISEEQSLAEGASAALLPAIRVSKDSPMASMPSSYEDHREIFSALWESINGAGSWAANPWVWVVEFKWIEGAPA